jgi:acetamidase/formamidase
MMIVTKEVVEMTVHTIEPDEHSLHGAFSRDFAPILTIDSGDTVRFRTLDAGWRSDPPPENGPVERQVEARPERRGDGHALCGPVAVRGARPGMTLEVRIGELRPGGWGWTYAHNQVPWLDLEAREPEGWTRMVWTLDVEAMVATNRRGRTVALRPFMGVMGMPPDAQGTHSTGPPRACGGNIDCRELIAGSTLYLPIAVEGALFSTGDGHGTQGDGEASGTAIECPMDLAEMTLSVRDDLRLEWPRAHTAAGWLTFGFHRVLDVAAAIALSGMRDLLSEQYGVDRVDALALASLVVDLRVTQMVNGVRGVHAVLPHGALR